MNPKSHGPLASILWQAWLPITLIVLWFAVSANSESIFWPPLTTILGALVEWAVDGSLWTDLLFSFGNYFAALALSIVVGLAFGVAIGMLPRVGQVLAPFLDFARTLPIVVFVPIVILALGVGRGPKIFLIFLACVWPILLNCIEGVRAISPSVFETARAYRIPLRLRVPKVVLAGALPQIAVGVRLAVTIGIVMLVVSEMYGSTEGLGNFVLQSGQRFQLPETWAGTIVIGVIGWAFTAIYAVLEHRLLAWTRQDGEATTRRAVRRGIKK